MIQWTGKDTTENTFNDGLNYQRRECSCAALCRSGDFKGISHPELRDSDENVIYACHIIVRDNDALSKTLESYFNSEKILVKKEKS
jgi:hypothetical protein